MLISWNIILISMIIIVLLELFLMFIKSNVDQVFSEKLLTIEINYFSQIVLSLMLFLLPLVKQFEPT